MTKFHYKLNELPSFYGGMLVLPATADTVAGFIAAAEAAPEELSTIANIMTAPPMPFLPEDKIGSIVILGMIGFAGDAEAGERAVAAIPRPGPSRLPTSWQPGRIGDVPGDGGRATITHAVSSEPAHRPVDSSVAARFLEFLEKVRRLPSRGAAARAGRRWRGALGRDGLRPSVQQDHGQPRRFLRGRGARAAKEAWVKDFAAAIDQGDRAVYSNFVGDEGPERVRQAYPGSTWDRLVEIKRRYDPTNLFRLNQNVTP